ncbi:MAG: hypothetical protein WCD44_00210, partial [Candidatus Babeliales bacterium]
MQNKYFFIFYFFISYNLINTMDFTDDFANLQQQSIMLQSSPLSTKKINHLSNLLFFSSPEIESCLLDLQFLENFPVYRQQFSIKCLQQGCNSIVKSKKNLDMLVKLIKSHMNTKHPSTPPYTNEEFMEYINKFHTKKPILSQRTDKKGIHFSLICPYCNQIFNNLLRKGLI